MKEFRLHGPPGCGKSHALATRWVPDAAERFGGSRVVICSLTKTAAKEIASRDLPIPSDNVGTLHALAFRAMGRPPIAEAMVDEWNEANPMFRLGTSSPNEENPEIQRSSVGDELMTLAQVLRHTRTPRSKWRPDVAAFDKKWRAWMQETGCLDFTALIEKAIDEVDTAPGHPAVFVVDEAQDCSQLELDLVRKWASAAEYVVLAGDGDQAIYGWRGASVKAFLGTDIPEEANYHLTQSFRVPRAVHLEASKWISRASFRYAVHYEPRDFEGEVTTTRGSSKNVEPLIEDVMRDVQRGKTVMILGSCAYMLRGVIAVMRREGIPFHNQFRPSNVAWNPLRGGAARLRNYLRPDAEMYGEAARVWTWREAANWVEILRARGVLPASGKTWIQQQAKEDDRARAMIEEGDGRAVFGDSWDQMFREFDSGDPLAWLHSRVMPSKAKTMEYAFAMARKQGKSSLLEDPKITIGTIHSVKGGQADVVYLLPDLSPSGIREWTTPGEGRDGIIRTFYVGMTRAREKLVACRRWSARAIDWVVT